MVNKVHFGKRLSSFRRKAGVSQMELAEKLGVTSQAVSKWECGNAVPDIDILLELSHLYKATINEMLEDIDLLCELTGKETGHTGIAYFVPEQERNCNIAWANEIRDGKWIKLSIHLTFIMRLSIFAVCHLRITVLTSFRMAAV